MDQSELDKKLHIITRAAKIKFCKDCAFHSCNYDNDVLVIRHRCLHPDLLDMVTGLPTAPIENRKNEALCGRRAGFFVDKKGTPAFATIKTGT